VRQIPGHALSAAAFISPQYPRSNLRELVTLPTMYHHYPEDLIFPTGRLRESDKRS
jgi:hypothetical protein